MTDGYQELKGMEVLEEKGEPLDVVSVAAGVKEILLLKMGQSEVSVEQGAFGQEGEIVELGAEVPVEYVVEKQIAGEEVPL